MAALFPPGSRSGTRREAHHGIDYVSEAADVEVVDGRGAALEASLAPWAPLSASRPRATPRSTGLSTWTTRRTALLEELATGRWLDRHDWRRILKPGQLPWEAFRFQEAKAVLAGVDWVMPLEGNERDAAWRQLSTAGL